jgi:hypothetical protein
LQKITFINSRGDTIVIGYHHPFFLSKIEGLGDVDLDIQTQKAPYQDGSTYTGATLSERHIPIEVAILEDLQANRQILSKIFNPKLGEGLLIYENDLVRREIKAIPEHVPKFPDVRPRITQKTIIDLFCPSPYWLTEEKVDQLVVWDGGLEFPLQMPTEFAKQSESKAKILLNEGDVATPIFIVFHGPATAPIKIINKTTGEFIEVNQSLMVGERLEINTAFGQKRVNKVLANGNVMNAFHNISLDSIFFQLEHGNNLIDYSSGADYERAGVTITWRNRYLAV